MNLINNVSLVEDCTGCGLCSFICPKDAIKITDSLNRDHFNYPLIDNTKCFNCGLCFKKCPAANKIKNLFDVNSSVYYFRLNNNAELLKSSSGGAFQAIAKHVLDGNTAIYGASWDGLKVLHKRITTIEEFDSMLSSKYIQSFIDKNIYKSIKDDLKNGLRVVFSGTPCQAAAVHTLLNNEERKRCLLIEILCHGVPNQWGFDKCIEHEERILKCKINEFGFRYKIDNNQDNRKFYLKYSKGSKNYKIVGDFRFSPFYRYFYTYSIYRNSCYECNFRKNRFSDLVIGDFWGVTKLIRIESGWSNSFIFPLTEKGNKIANRLGVKTNISVEEIAKYNESFIKTKPPEKKYSDFYNNVVSFKWYRKQQISPLRSKLLVFSKNIIKRAINLFLPEEKKKKLGKVTFFIEKQ